MPHASLVRRVSIVAAAAAAVACAALGVQSATAAAAFPTHGRFDYQIGGVYTPASTTAIVTRDVTATPASGKYNICYINAFQTQPGEGSQWDSSLLLKNRNGKNLVDPDWKDEFILDTTTDTKRQAIFTRLKGLLDTCASKGFDAVEPDNLDTYTRDYIRKNAKLPPTKANNVALLALLSSYAHSKGMLIAQKNTVEDSAYIKQNASTDFAVAEECQRYSECQGYTDVYGAKVIEIEYNDYDDVDPTAVFTAACAARGATASVIQRDRDVVAKGKSGYVYKLCSTG